MSSIAHVFFETDMRNGHDGLTKRLGKIILKPGETAIFINRKWTALKLLTPEYVVLHLRPKHGLNPAAIKYLPACIEGKELNYQRALESAIHKRFAKDYPNRRLDVP